MTATYVYDPLNHVTQIEQNGATSGPGLLAAYSYDGAGRRTAVSRAGGAGLATSYGYDAISRLSSLTQTLASSAGTTFTLGYNPANQVISRADSNGAFTVRPSAISLTYTANGLNQYSSISGGAQTLTGAPQATLAYDPLGRIQSVTTSGSTSNFLYDGAFLAEEYNASGTTTARYVPGPGTDEPLTVYSGASLSYPNWYAADQEGSTIATANSSATEVASFAYGPYGEPLTSAGAPAWAGTRYRYTGQIVIAGAHNYFYKARMYDPSTGRFLQTDPAGFGGGVNLYAYVLDDPINGWDPAGQTYTLIGITNIGNVQCDTYISDEKDPSVGDFGVTVNAPKTSCTTAGSPPSNFANQNPNSQFAGPGVPTVPQSNFKLPPCGNGTAAKIADWADKISVGTGAVAVTSGALGLITAPSGAGFVGFEAVAALSGGASAIASGVGAVAHFANGDYVGAALDAGGIIGGFAAGKLAGGAIASTRTFNNLTASQVR